MNYFIRSFFALLVLCKLSTSSAWYVISTRFFFILLLQLIYFSCFLIFRSWNNLLMTSTRVSVIATFNLFPLGGFLFQKPAALAGPTVRRHRWSSPTGRLRFQRGRTLIPLLPAARLGILWPSLPETSVLERARCDLSSRFTGRLSARLLVSCRRKKTIRFRPRLPLPLLPLINSTC